MKTAITSFLALLVCLPIAGQELHLSAGDSFSYSFDSLPLVGPCSPGTCRAIFQVHFSNDLFGLGDSIRLEMFEDSLAGNPFAALTFTGAATALPVLTLGVQGLPGFSDPWQDLQGAVRVSVIEGSADLVNIRVFTDIDRALFFGLQIVPVTEPCTLSLLLLGAIAAGQSVLKKRKSLSSQFKKQDVRAGRSQR